MKVLWAVIDDAEAFLVERACAKKEYQVRTVRTARQAREEIARGDYDIAVVDQNLPDVIGIELVRQLHAEGVQIPFAIYADLRFEKNGGLPEEGSHAGAAVFAKETDPTCTVIVEQLPRLLWDRCRH